MSRLRSRRSGLEVSGLSRLLLIIACLVCSSPLLGQGSLSTIRGTVTDPSGGVVPQAKVAVEEAATGITSRTLTTDTQGNYEVPGLKEGTYRLRVEAARFETSVVSKLHLAGNETGSM